MQISKLHFTDPDYPDELREIASPPKQLYILGELPNHPAVAVVGTRHLTAYGKAITYQIVGELAAAGVSIISGLAYGIDATVHQATLEARGQTVAVLAGGLDHIYPAGHRDLARRILQQGGGLVSEYDVGTESFKSHFVARNRIISGLSQAVIVPEAGDSSGALITSNFALQQNRLVMAVPGNITNPTSVGPNNLIKAGAIPITCASDVLAALDLTAVGFKVSAQAKSQDEATILDLLAKGINSSDDLIRESDLNASQFANVITLMEITGKVRNLGAGNWVAR